MRHRGERGFALLLVFAMAAAMAMLLYMEAPRVLFEAQRNKEQLLIERGEQYKRAIQVYYRKNKKLPQRIEDLERGTETRFLRQRYLDPFTGKDDWKLIETDGVNLKNSLVKKPTAALASSGRPGDPPASGEPATPLTGQAGQQQQQQTFNAFGQPVQQQPCIPGQPCEVNQALQRRGSDRPAAVAGTQPGGGGGEQGLPACDPTQAVDPARCDPGKLWDPAAAQLAAQQQLQQPGVPGQSPFPGQPYPGAQGGYPGQQSFPGAPGGQQTGNPGVPSGYPGFPGGFPGAAPAGGPRPGSFVPPGGAPISSQAGGAARSPIPGGGGLGSAFPGAVAGQQQQQGNQALGMIQKLLSTPRQGGAPGQGSAAALGPGIVGVATKHEGLGIKIYAEREKYQEWEFVYDPKEEKAPNMAGNQPGQQPGANNGNPLGSPGSNSPGSNNNGPGTSPTVPSPFGGGPPGGAGGGFGRQR